MIYAPQIPFNVQLSIVTAFVNAIARLAVDYVRQQNQPWEYYLGIGLGGAALTTGIPGANAIMYAAGTGVKLFLETSPGATQAEIFLDGISEANLDLNDEIIDTIEHLVNLPNDGQYHSISILNIGTAVDVEDPTDWLAILGIELIDAIFAEREFIPMAVVIHSFTIKDAKTLATARVKNRQSVAVYHPLGTYTMAEINGYHNALAEAIDNVTDGQIIATHITIQPTFPTGLKVSPVAGSDVQEGGNLSFQMESGYSEGIRIPAIAQAVLGTDGVSIDLEDAQVDALKDLLLGDIADPLDITASDPNGILLTALTSGAKSFRK